MKAMGTRWKTLSAFCVSAVWGLAGCGGVSAPPVTFTPPPTTTYGPTNASVYVIQGTSSYNDQVLKFAAGSAGSVTPTLTITTNLYLTAVAVGISGQIYAAGLNNQTSAATVNVYQPNANLVGTLAVPQQPIALAVDAVGTIYLTDSSGEILVYPAGASSPSRTIAGSSTGIATPEAIAVDSAGTIYLSSYVPSTGASAILLFNSTATGNVAPMSSITPPNGTAFFGVAVDAAKNVYATTDALGASTSSTVLEYAVGASGAAAPIKTISGSSTLLSTGSSDVGALALDSAGNLYMPLEVIGPNTTSYSLLEFAAGSNGNAIPAARVSSSAWSAAGGQIAAM